MSDIKDFTEGSDLNDELVRRSSPLLDPLYTEYVDALEGESASEGIVPENILPGVFSATGTNQGLQFGTENNVGFMQSKNYVALTTGWRLDSTGALYAFSGTFAGSITATSGTIGGFNVGATDLSVTAGGNTTILSSGATAFSAGPTGVPTFTVTQAGALTATSATITGAITITSGSGIANLSDAGALAVLDTVYTAQIASAAVTTAKIAAGAVTAAEIATGAVGSNEIAAGAIITGKITAGTIVAADIAAGTITGAKIAATTITAANIAALTITAGEIAANTITASQLAATAIDAMTVTGATLRTAASGQRVVMNSAGIGLFDSADVQVGWLNASATESTNGLVLKSASDETLLHIENTATGALTKETAIIVNRGTGKSAAFFKTYNVAAAATTVEVHQAGTGTGLSVNVALATNAGYAGDFRNAGTSGGALYCFTGAASTSTVAKFEQTATVSTNFKRILNLDGIVIFKSDGTTPNGNLTGALGDICVGADGGKTYYCSTAGTTWTAV